MGLTIEQIPDELAELLALNDWLEVHDTSLGRSVRMKGEWLPGRKDNSLPAARLAASATNILFGRSTAGAGAGEEVPCTSVGRQLLAVATVPAARVALGLEIGVDVQTQDAFLQALADAPDAATIQALIALVPGTHVQAFSGELAALAALVSAADSLPYFDGVDSAALTAFTAAGRALVGGADAAAQRNTLGLNNKATHSSGFTFTAAATAYTTEVQVAIFRAPYAMTIQSAHLISHVASAGSTGSKYWKSEIKNATAGNSLCSAPWQSDASELAPSVAKDLGVNQNLNINAGDVIVATILSLGGPTTMQHGPWTWVIVGIPT